MYSSKYYKIILTHVNRAYAGLLLVQRDIYIGIVCQQLKGIGNINRSVYQGTTICGSRTFIFDLHNIHQIHVHLQVLSWSPVQYEGEKKEVSAAESR